MLWEALEKQVKHDYDTRTFDAKTLMVKRPGYSGEWISQAQSMFHGASVP